MYDNTKIYGPYLNIKDGRLRITIIDNLTKKRKTMSYPKYIMECHLNRQLEKDETIHHIDGNPLNNDISNLEILPREEHCKNDAIRNKNIKVKCAYCGKEFEIIGPKVHLRNRQDRHSSGYFCSKECSGKYGKEIQMRKRTHNNIPKEVVPKYKISML